jgi:hypothetical protein
MIADIQQFYTTNQTTYFSPEDCSTRGVAFAREAVRLLPLEDNGRSLPVAQGLVFLTIYEGEFGSVPNFLNYFSRFADQYHKLRISERLSLASRASDNQVKYALSWIDWGFYVLEWSVYGQQSDLEGLLKSQRKFVVPLNSRKSIRKPGSPQLWRNSPPLESQEESLDYWWFAYPVSVLPQRSYKREIFIAECELTEIIEDVLDFLIPLEGQDSPVEAIGKAKQLYGRLVEWKLSLPDCLRPQSAILPTAIVLQ